MTTRSSLGSSGVLTHQVLGRTGSSAPVREKLGQVRTTDDAVTVDVELGIVRPPRRKKDREVLTIDQEISVEVADGTFVGFDEEPGEAAGGGAAAVDAVHANRILTGREPANRDHLDVVDPTVALVVAGVVDPGGDTVDDRLGSAVHDLHQLEVDVHQDVGLVVRTNQAL